MALVDEMLADSPRVLWTLQDVSSPAQDSSGNDLDATSDTGVDYAWGAGPRGSDTSVRIQGGESINRSQVTAVTDELTLVAFIKPIDLLDSNQTIIANSAGGSNGYALLAQSDGKLRGVCQGVAFLSIGTTAMTSGQWNLVALRRDNGVWSYWLNNALDLSNAGSTNPNTPSGGGTGLNGSASLTAQYAYAAVYESALPDSRLAAYWAALTEQTRPFANVTIHS